MKTTYRVLAFLVAAEVVIQAAAIAYAVFGLGKYIDDGAVVDKATQESGVTFEGVIGFIVHGINGEMVIPLIALILFVVSFFAKIRGGVLWAGILLALVVLQVLLGFFAHEVPFLGAIHGLNALAVFTVAFMAGMRARSGAAVTASTTPADRATV
jgi:hypothetical protein